MARRTPRTRTVPPPNGTWVVGVDNGGTAYLFKQGVGDPSGNAATAAGLSNWINLHTTDLTTMTLRLGAALNKLRLPQAQQNALIQSVDVGSIQQGGQYVAIGGGIAGQGQAPSASQGQAPSGSSAVGVGLGDTGLFRSIAGAINSTADFLKFIAWIFHPRNLLRDVEFLVGITMMAFGIHAAMQARGERVEGFSTSESALTRSGLGRVASELARATRSGQAPQRPRSAPHRTRQRALAQRYRREEDLQRRRAKAPRPKKSP